jgi:hypothetical protein
MAPRRKKQKIEHALDAADATVRRISEPASERVPTEVLQIIFGYLGFYDLMRCRHVSRKWSLLIPGDDPGLKEILFLTTKLPPWTDELQVQARKHFSKNRGHTFCMSPGRLHIVTSTSKLQINPLFLSPRWNQFAYPGLREPPPKVRFSWHEFDFTSVEQLRQIAASLESRVDEGLWTDMLICAPPVRSLKLRLTVYLGSFCVHFRRTLTDNRGIRFQGLVDLMRILLKEIAEKIMIHKITLRYKKVVEIFDWLGDCAERHDAFEVFQKVRIMETMITDAGDVRMVW